MVLQRVRHWRQRLRLLVRLPKKKLRTAMQERQRATQREQIEGSRIVLQELCSMVSKCWGRDMSNLSNLSSCSMSRGKCFEGYSM
jgi:hypothetical protein